MHRLLVLVALLLALLLGAVRLHAAPPAPVPYPVPGGPCVTDTPTPSNTPTPSPSPLCWLTPTPPAPETATATATPTATPGAAVSLVVEGDSLSVSAWPGDALTLLAGRYTLAGNVAHGGDRVHAMVAEGPIEVDPLFNGARTNIATLWAGTNDLGLDQAPPAQVYADIRQWHRDRHTAHAWRTIALTITYRGDVSSTLIDAVNDQVRAHWPEFADGLVDLNQDPHLIDPHNTAYYENDALHLNGYGQAVVGARLAAAIEALGGLPHSALQADYAIGDLSEPDGSPIAGPWPDSGPVRRDGLLPYENFRPLYRLNQHAGFAGAVLDAAHPGLLTVPGMRLPNPAGTFAVVASIPPAAQTAVLVNAPGGGFTWWLASPLQDGSHAGLSSVMPAPGYPPDLAHSFGVPLPADGAPHVLVLTLAPGTATLYVDGAVAATETLDFPPGMPADPWLGGNGTGNYNARLTLFAARLYDTALPADQIQALTAAWRVEYGF